MNTSSDTHLVADNLTVHVNDNDPCRTEFPPSESGATVHLFKGQYVVTESNFESIKIGDNTKGPKDFTLIVSLANEKWLFIQIVDRCFYLIKTQILDLKFILSHLFTEETSLVNLLVQFARF